MRRGDASGNILTEFFFLFGEERKKIIINNLYDGVRVCASICECVCN